MGIKEIIEQNNLFQKGNFILSSGVESEYYIDFRKIFHNVQTTNQIVDIILQQENLYKLQTDFFYGIPNSCSILSILCQQKLNKNGFFLRQKDSDKTTGKMFGNVTIIEDVLTTGNAVIQNVEFIKNNFSVDCINLIVLLNRSKLTSLKNVDKTIFLCDIKELL